MSSKCFPSFETWLSYSFENSVVPQSPSNAFNATCSIIKNGVIFTRFADQLNTHVSLTLIDVSRSESLVTVHLGVDHGLTSDFT